MPFYTYVLDASASHESRSVPRSDPIFARRPIFEVILWLVVPEMYCRLAVERTDAVRRDPNGLEE